MTEAEAVRAVREAHGMDEVVEVLGEFLAVRGHHTLVEVIAMKMAEEEER